MEAAKEAVLESMKQIAKDAAVKEVVNFSETYLPYSIKGSAS